MKKNLLLILFLLATSFCFSQVRFYAQFKSIPFTEASTNDFNILTGVKLDPNKEFLIGFGLTGSLSPRNLRGDLKFNKSNISFGFNYYFNRRFYLNGELNFNLLQGIVTDIIDTNVIGASENLLKKFFFDYDINVTYVVLQRFHFSFGTGVADFASLASNTTSEIIEGKFQFNVALSLKVYAFQIKY